MSGNAVGLVLLARTALGGGSTLNSAKTFASSPAAASHYNPYLSLCITMGGTGYNTNLVDRERRLG